MAPEGIVDALRHVCEGLVPGGRVVDLQAIEPSGRVEVDREVAGQIDDSRFFERARRSVAGLDQLAADGILRPGGHDAFDTLVRYDSGDELVAAVAESTERMLPAALAVRLAGAGPVVVRERSLVRVFERVSPGDDAEPHEG
jgi:hypothetical protein